MVKQIEKPEWPLGKPIGHIRISGKSLIELLRKYESTDIKISAETKNHSFEGVDDMEENLPLLQGKTTVKLQSKGQWANQITIKFNYCTSIETRANTETENTEIKALRQKLEADLKSLRTPIIWIFTLIPRFVWWGIILGLILSNVAPIERSNQPETHFEASFALIPWAMWIISLFINLFNPVYYSRQDTFWQRNKDKFIVGVIMLLAGAALTEFLPKIKELF
ncbi:MAG: hypothetical protein JJ869_02910 [Marivita sp.]|uniref:hypothetical protein n=1 Tax=Marivita sp. TaxID=2003365 RepID=UPI001B1D2735|nr:hypothetical protein [Marivita sp.]MBO6882515.1 hypothetical protein [Marivita sp.]